MNSLKKALSALFIFLISAAALLPVLVLVIGAFLPESAAETMLSASGGAAESFSLLRECISLSLEQFKSVLIATPDYLIRFWNTVKLVVPVVIGQLFFASLASYGLSQARGKGYAAFLLLYLVLMMLPYQVTVVPNYYAVKSLNLLDTDFAIWLPGIFSPFSVYLLTRAMKKIPRDIIGAAKTDGASDLTVFFRIVLPLCKGQLAALALLITIDYWNQVELPLMMYSDATQYPLSVLLSKIREDAVGISFAASFIYVLPVFLLCLLGMDELKEGIANSRAD